MEVNSVDSVGPISADQLALVNQGVAVVLIDEVDLVGIVEDNPNKYSFVIYVRGFLRA